MQPGDRVTEIGCGVGFVGTIASRIAGHGVRPRDANPAMVAAARRTIERNGASATVATAVLQHRPTAGARVARAWHGRIRGVEADGLRRKDLWHSGDSYG